MSTPRTALVTGGTSGVGLSMVHHLVRGGFFVYFVGTHQQRGDALAAELNQGTRCAEFVRLDLSDLAAVLQFAAAMNDTLASLDVLANVAGVLLPKRTVTALGLETTLTIGHFAPFVLMTSLLPALQRATHGRIINVSGSARGIQTPSLNWDDLNLENTYSPIRAAVSAVHSKTVMTQLLATKLAPLSIDVNAFHPGLVRSSLGRNLPWFLRWPFRALQPMLSPTTKSGCYLCTCPPGATGQLFTGTAGSPLTFDKDYADKVWTWTLNTVDRVLPKHSTQFANSLHQHE